MDQRSDPYNLDRFLQAQADSYAEALAELRAGAKRTHWMWYIFPQLRGLGASSTARYFAIGSREEARAYLEHPLLGPRLRECCAALLDVDGRTATDILGCPDDLKLRSSATLFSELSEPGSVFSKLLLKYFGGEPDRKSMQLLQEMDSPS